MAGVDQAQHRAAAVAVVLEVAEHLEAAGEVALALAPAPADQRRAGRRRRRARRAERWPWPNAPRRALEAQRRRCAPAAAGCPGRTARGGRARPAGAGRRAAGPQLELVLVAAREELGRPRRRPPPPSSARSSSSRSRATVSPIAWAWPPKRSSRLSPAGQEAVQRDRRGCCAPSRWRSRRPRPGAAAGRLQLLGDAGRRRSRPRPGATPSLQATSDRRQRRARRRASRRASSTTRALLRLALAVPAVELGGELGRRRPSSRLSSSSSARSASSSRPAALSRGPSRKPTSAASNGGVTPAWRNSARSPGERVLRRAPRGRARRSPGSRRSAARGRRWSRGRRSAAAAASGEPCARSARRGRSASLSARPTPARSGNG